MTYSSDGDLYGDNTPESIIQILRQLLDVEIGEFTTGLKAFWIAPPKAPEVSQGLAVILNRMPNQISSEVYEWQLSLRQYTSDLDGVKTLENAARKVRLRFPLSRENPSPFVPGSPIQIVFRLRFNRSAYPFQY